MEREEENLCLNTLKWRQGGKSANESKCIARVAFHVCLWETLTTYEKEKPGVKNLTMKKWGKSWTIFKKFSWTSEKMWKYYFTSSVHPFHSFLLFHVECKLWLSFASRKGSRNCVKYIKKITKTEAFQENTKSCSIPFINIDSNVDWNLIWKEFDLTFQISIHRLIPRCEMCRIF